MARTTPDRVREIFQVKSTVDLGSFISTASSLVDELCVPAGVYSDARLRDLETYLAAHFANVMLPRVTHARVDEAEKWYESGLPDFGLKLTKYGQQALVLDTAGLLAPLVSGANTKVTVNMTSVWLGTECR